LVPVGGSEELCEQGLTVILPILRRERHGLMTAALADDLRGWLVEPISPAPREDRWS
jgi:hypothetical protein